MTDRPAHVSFLETQQSHTQPVSLPADSTACEMGTPCINLLVVTKGCLKVSGLSEDGRYLTLYRVRPFDTCFLTISCILNGTTFPAVATIEEDLEGLLIPASKVMQWMTESNDWRDFIFRHMAKRLCGMVELTDSIAFDKLNKRLANWLCLNCADETCKVTHQNLADELGTSREVITRALRHLKTNDMIKLHHGAIEVIDPTALQQIT